MMEAMLSTETSVFTRATQRHIPEDGIFICVCVFTGLVATPYETPQLRMVGSPPPSHLDPTIYRSERGASVGTSIPAGTGNSINSVDMLAVAIKIQMDDSVHNLKVRL
jgi:hypothetical protein